MARIRQLGKMLEPVIRLRVLEKRFRTPDHVSLARDVLIASEKPGPNAPDGEEVIGSGDCRFQATLVVGNAKGSFYPFVMSRSVLRKLHFI
jgi:hypothetical protein